MTARSLRVLNVVEAPPDGARVDSRARGVHAANLSLTPCEDCTSKCCSMLAIVSSADAVHLAAGTRRPLTSLVEPRPWHTLLGTLMGWPIKLPEGRVILAFRHDDGACAQLVRSADGSSGCGVYEHRASICRLYPFDLLVDGGRIPAGSQVHCPVQWLQNDALRARLEADVARFEETRRVDLQVVRFWNRGAKPRSARRFFEFLAGPVARELGYDEGDVLV